jgi:hypothetical protein
VESSIVELIKGLVQVKDALSLAAFLALVLLVAFRTTKVPELFFGLLRDKLTRQQFASLLNRFMLFGFIGFLALLALAVTSQVLSRWTQPNVLTVDDLRSELAKTSQSVEKTIHAESQYTLAMEKLEQRDFDGAIASLKDSIESVATLTAQEMLVYLYRQKGDFVEASNARDEAARIARERGDTLALARLDNAAVPGAIPNPVGEQAGSGAIARARAGTDVVAAASPGNEGGHSLVGATTPLPAGGDRYETATTLAPGLYWCSDENSCGGYYSMHLETGQKMTFKFRNVGLTGAQFYGTDGQSLGSAGGNGNPAIYQIDWTATESGTYFLSVGGHKGAAFRLEIQ